MAKRKRLTPPREDFLTEAATAPKAALAPIAQVVGDAAGIAGAQEMADALNAARSEGRLLLNLPLDDVDPAYLVRDRLAANDAEMEELCASLKARGQQMPIEVAELGAGRYGLISGWRRLSALKRLRDETREQRFETILARVTAPADASQAYLAMVEENEVRAGLSYYERARIVVKAVEAGVFQDEKDALRSLYAAASRAKRSKIKSFVGVVRALDTGLQYPVAIGERLGLELARRLTEDMTFRDKVLDALAQGANTGHEAEQLVLKQALSAGLETKAASGSMSPGPSRARTAPAVQEKEDGGQDVHVTYEAGAGRLVLTGRGVTPQLHRALKDWLAMQDRPGKQT